MQDWQTFLSLEHVWQSTVFLKRPSPPVCQRNTVYGRLHTWHSCGDGRRGPRQRGRGGTGEGGKSEELSMTTTASQMATRACSSPLWPPRAAVHCPFHTWPSGCFSMRVKGFYGRRR